MVWDMNVLNLWYLNVGGSSSPMEHLGMAVENFQMNESYLPTETLMDSHQPETGGIPFGKFQLQTSYGGMTN